MRLYFVRHGQAADRLLWDQPDALRPLTEDGISRMEKSARTMVKLGLGVDLILTSPLVRARQTADIVAEALGCPVEESDAVLDLDVDVLGELLLETLSADSLMLVGHEPDFSQTVEGLIGGGRVAVKKGSLIRVDLFSTYPPQGELVWSIPPKLLAL